MPYKSAEDRKRYSRESKARWLVRHGQERAAKISEQKRRSFLKCRPDAVKRAKRHDVEIEAIDYGMLLSAWDGICGICRTMVMPDEDANWDHIVPLSRRGRHAEDNLQRVHAVCNRRKGARIAA